MYARAAAKSRLSIPAEWASFRREGFSGSGLGQEITWLVVPGRSSPKTLSVHDFSERPRRIELVLSNESLASRPSAGDLRVCHRFPGRGR